MRSRNSPVTQDNTSNPGRPTFIRRGERLHFLDALRGIAATYVVLFHLVYVGGVAAPSWLSGFLAQGGTGVMLFFVVSCFSLFFTMPARLKEARPIVSFFTHRFFRIAPLFYAWLVVTCILMTQVYHLPVTPAAVLQSIFFVFNLVPGNQSGLVMASWTIGVEMLFYAIFPIIYFRTRNLVEAWSLLLATLLAYFAMIFILPHLPLSPETAASIEQWLFIKDLPIFAFGAVCYYMLRERLVNEPDEQERSLGILLLLAAACIFVARSNSWVDDRIFAGHPYMWPAVWYSLLIIGLALNPIRLLVNRLTRFLGTISYSLYLAHGPVINTLRPWYDRLNQHHDWPATQTYMIAAIGTLLVSIAIAYATYRLIEVPFIRYGKVFYSRFFGNRQDAVTSRQIGS
ncbi:acyltransferase [Stenotrophomonas maltophilia]|nr:acyltransferase [Stenotrophomonas maltophilia]